MHQHSLQMRGAWIVYLLLVFGCSSEDAGPDVDSVSQNDARSETQAQVPGIPATKPVAGQSVQPAITSRAGGDSSDRLGTPQIPAIQDTIVAPAATGSEPSEKIPMLEVGAVAPDFVSMDLAGQEVRLSDLKDQVVVLDFWATWCGPCLASLPSTEDVAQRAKNDGVVVLAVCTGDTRAKFETYVEANQSKFPNVMFTCDPNERDSETFDDRASRKLFGVSGIPAQFVIDRDGTIAAVLSGYEKGDSRLEEALASLGIHLEPPSDSTESP